VRIDYGLAPAANWTEVTSNPNLQAALSSVYASVDDIDPWIGGLCEDHVEGAMVGETFFVILADQFARLRDGDRFFYRGALPPPLVQLVEQQTLGMIIQRNTGIGGELQPNVFFVGQTDMALQCLDIHAVAETGAVQVQFNTQPGNMYDVKSSSDLVNWTPLMNDMRSQGWTTLIDDPGAATLPMRTYLILELP